MAMTTEYKGLPVRKHSAAVRGASGDALNSALKVSPQDFMPGEKGYMVLEVVSDGENFKPMDEGDAWEEVQIVRVTRGAFVDPQVALRYLDEVTAKIEELRIEETGQERLALSTVIEELQSEHERGLHKRKRGQCPLCKPVTDEDHARLEEFEIHQRENANGAGDADNPLPPARTRRSRAKPAAKKAPAKKTTRSRAKK